MSTPSHKPRLVFQVIHHQALLTPSSSLSGAFVLRDQLSVLTSTCRSPERRRASFHSMGFLSQRRSRYKMSDTKLRSNNETTSCVCGHEAVIFNCVGRETLTFHHCRACCRGGPLRLRGRAKISMHTARVKVRRRPVASEAVGCAAHDAFWYLGSCLLQLRLIYHSELTLTSTVRKSSTMQNPEQTSRSHESTDSVQASAGAVATFGS